MKSTDQLDFAKPEHVSIICKDNQLTVHIKGTTSSIKLTYQLQEETTPDKLFPGKVTYHTPLVPGTISNPSGSGYVPYTTPPFAPRPPYGPTTSGVLHSPHPPLPGYPITRYGSAGYESLGW